MITLVFLKRRLKSLYSFYSYIAVMLFLLSQIYSRNVFINQMKIYHCISIKSFSVKYSFNERFPKSSKMMCSFHLKYRFPFCGFRHWNAYILISWLFCFFFQLPVKYNLFLWNQKSLSAQKWHTSNLVTTLNFF